MTWSLYRCLATLRSISSQKPVFFSLTLHMQSRSMTHLHTEYVYDKECISLLYLSILASTLSEQQWLVQSLRELGFKPSSETIAPRYLKLVTVLSFYHLTLVSLWMPLGLCVICLVFSALISISYHVQVLSRLSTS